MSEIVETDGSAKPTPAGTSDAGDDPPEDGQDDDGNTNGEEENGELAELKRRAHPFAD